MIINKLQQFKELQEEMAKHLGIWEFDGNVVIADTYYWCVDDKEECIRFSNVKSNLSKKTSHFTTSFEEIFTGEELTAVEEDVGGYLIFLNSMEVKEIKEWRDESI